MQTHYKQLTDSQWQVMKTSLPIQRKRKRKKTRSIPQGFSEGVPGTLGKTSSFNQKQKPILLNLKMAGFVTIWLASKEKRFAIQNP